MQKRLALPAIATAMEKSGLSQASLAHELDVSRESVSKWLKGASLPRPDKLLKLALLLGLRLDELVIREPSDSEPVVAFRKRGASKTTDAHIARAMDTGRLLRQLVPYLPFDEFIQPGTLKDPTVDYGYVQRLAKRVRKDIGVAADDPVDYGHLIDRFHNTQTVLVPVLWGKKNHHENALHILLPDSRTTWVFLNLDVEVHDFKFWMAHELGHVLAPQLRANEGEDFADAFAGALLFPELLASRAYAELKQHGNVGQQINGIKNIAEKYLISPITVYYEINRHAEHVGDPPLKLEPGIFGAAKNLSKVYYSVSETLFGEDRPPAADYIALARELQSPFFEALKDFLRDKAKGPGFIQSVLDIPLWDAREIHAALV
jgi:transcriptional regulator with XRE-family HTH domain